VQIIRLSDDLGLQLVATNDAHFLRSAEHDAHDVLLCIGLKKDRLDADRMRYDRGLYFKSAPEIQAHFKGRTDVLENTLKVADDVNVIFDKKYYVPSFPLPTDVSSENDFLAKLATEGAKGRYGDPLPPEVQEHATGKGNAQKDEVLLATERRIPQAQVRNNDEADAVWIAVGASILAGSPVIDLPAAHMPKARKEKAARPSWNRRHSLTCWHEPGHPTLIVTCGSLSERMASRPRRCATSSPGRSGRTT